MTLTTPNAMQPYNALTPRDIDDQLPGWYDRWRARIHEWVSRHADDTFASIVTLVPDMLVLVVRLAKDKRVPWMLKGQLTLAAAYVISPVDLVPEALLGVIGLADDAGVLALVLFWLRGMAKVDLAVLRDNWSGRDDIDRVIDFAHEQITANRERIISHDVWQQIERRFGRPRRVVVKPRRLLSRLRKHA